MRALRTDRTHTSELHPAIEALLAEAGRAPREVGVIAFSQGPGSFTGLRVAATVARTWQSATGARVVGICSLDAIAHAAARRAEAAARLAVLVDARQGRAFAAQYAHDAAHGYTRLTDPELVEIGAWLASLDPRSVLTGDGCEGAAGIIAHRGLQVLDPSLRLPDAIDVLALACSAVARGEYLLPHEIVPRYIRRPECEEVYESRRAAAIERRAGGATPPQDGGHG